MAQGPMDLNQVRASINQYAKGKEKKERLSPVVKEGGIVSTQKSLGQKLKDMFIAEDVKDVKQYLLQRIFVPTMKNMFLDAMEMVLLGTPVRDHSARTTYSYSGGGTPYASYYKSQVDRGGGRSRNRIYDDDYIPNNKVDYRAIVLVKEQDAMTIVNDLRNSIRSYGRASIGDLLDTIDVTPRNVDYDWGWTEERAVGVRPVPGGYLIDVDPAVYIGDI